MIEIKSPFIEETKIYVDDIPIIRLKPKIKLEEYPTIIFYHGWSSSKESQRMRGYILSNLGFQVLLPDSINHGERGILKYEDPVILKDNFWSTVLSSLDESEKIIEYAVDKLQGDRSKIGISGHSMGGFISSGIFTHNRDIKTAIILNGSFNWNYCNELIASKIENTLDVSVSKELEKIQNRLIDLDPVNHIGKIKDRPVLMINGGADEVVPMISQKQFYEDARKKYNRKNLIDLIVYKELGHFVTTNMMEDSGKWFKKFL